MISLFLPTNVNWNISISSCTTGVIEQNLSHPTLLCWLRWSCRQRFCCPCLGQALPWCHTNKWGRDFQSICISSNRCQYQGTGRWWLLLFKKIFVLFSSTRQTADSTLQSQARQAAVLCMAGERLLCSFCNLQGCFSTSLAAGTVQWDVPRSVQGSSPHLLSLTDWNTVGFMRDLIPAVHKASPIP